MDNYDKAAELLRRTSAQRAHGIDINEEVAISKLHGEIKNGAWLLGAHVTKERGAPKINKCRP